MVYLLFALLAVGLIQSLLEVFKEDPKTSKWGIKRILSMLYVAGFILGVIIVMVQEQEENRINELIGGISSLVSQIDSNSIRQLETTTKTMQQTQALISKSDSINKGLTEVIRIKDSLMTQYKNVNLRLSKQLGLELERFEGRAPDITLLDQDMSWEGSDSTTHWIRACIRNFGKRNALIERGHGFALFFNRDNKPFFSIDIPGNANQGTLEPNDVEHMHLCYMSYGIRGFQLLKSKTWFAIIYLKIHYKDVSVGRDSVRSFYEDWVPKRGFGGPRDWQIKSTQAWAIAHHKL